jgi:hypothetical protein
MDQSAINQKIGAAQCLCLDVIESFSKVSENYFSIITIKKNETIINSISTQIDKTQVLAALANQKINLQNAITVIDNKITELNGL